MIPAVIMDTEASYVVKVRGYERSMIMTAVHSGDFAYFILNNAGWCLLSNCI